MSLLDSYPLAHPIDLALLAAQSDSSARRPAPARRARLRPLAALDRAASLGAAVAAALAATPGSAGAEHGNGGAASRPDTARRSKGGPAASARSAALGVAAGTAR